MLYEVANPCGSNHELCRTALGMQRERTGVLCARLSPVGIWERGSPVEYVGTVQAQQRPASHLRTTEAFHITPSPRSLSPLTGRPSAISPNTDAELGVSRNSFDVLDFLSEKPFCDKSGPP